jgi:hypothetical protein
LSAESRNYGLLLLIALCALVATLFYAVRFPLLHTRTFDPDEFQHLHAAWALHEGQTPFRDFFEHHMPAIQLLLAPMMRGFDIAASADDAIGFMFAARVVMTIFAAATVMATAVLGREVGGATTGWIAAALLSISIVFLGRSLEIRPDTPGVALWIASLLAWTYALARAENGSHVHWAVTGLFLGLALAFNQKLLLAGPGLAVWSLAYVVGGRAARAPGRIDPDRVLQVLVLLSAAAVPLLVLALWFWREGAFAAMLHGSIAANLGWPREATAGGTLRWMALRDPMFSAVVVGGLVREGFLLIRARSLAGPSGVLWCSAVSLLLFFFVTPTPFPQYLLLVLPIVAVFAARLLWAAVAARTASSECVARQQSGLDAAVTAVVTAATLAAALWIARPVYLHPAVYPVVLTAAAMLAAALARRRLPAIAAAVVLGAMVLYPLQQLRWMAGLSNGAQVAAIRWVHGETKPADKVLDGFTGYAWFRPQAGYYGFLHPGVRAFLRPAERASIAGLLADCSTRPKLVILDTHLAALSPDVVPLVRHHYVPARPPIWLRRDVMEDCQHE